MSSDVAGVAASEVPLREFIGGGSPTPDPAGELTLALSPTSRVDPLVTLSSPSPRFAQPARPAFRDFADARSRPRHAATYRYTRGTGLAVALRGQIGSARGFSREAVRAALAAQGVERNPGPPKAVDLMAAAQGFNPASTKSHDAAFYARRKLRNAVRLAEAGDWSKSGLTPGDAVAAATLMRDVGMPVWKGGKGMKHHVVESFVYSKVEPGRRKGESVLRMCEERVPPPVRRVEPVLPELKVEYYDAESLGWKGGGYDAYAEEKPPLLPSEEPLHFHWDLGDRSGHLVDDSDDVKGTILKYAADKLGVCTAVLTSPGVMWQLVSRAPVVLDRRKKPSALLWTGVRKYVEIYVSTAARWRHLRRVEPGVSYAAAAARGVEEGVVGSSLGRSVEEVREALAAQCVERRPGPGSLSSETGHSRAGVMVSLIRGGVEQNPGPWATEELTLCFTPRVRTMAAGLVGVTAWAIGRPEPRVVVRMARESDLSARGLVKRVADAARIAVRLGCTYAEAARFDGSLTSGPGPVPHAALTHIKWPVGPIAKNRPVAVDGSMADLSWHCDPISCGRLRGEQCLAGCGPPDEVIVLRDTTLPSLERALLRAVYGPVAVYGFRQLEAPVWISGADGEGNVVVTPVTWDGKSNAMMVGNAGHTRVSMKLLGWRPGTYMLRTAHGDYVLRVKSVGGLMLKFEWVGVVGDRVGDVPPGAKQVFGAVTQHGFGHLTDLPDSQVVSYDWNGSRAVVSLSDGAKRSLAAALAGNPDMSKGGWIAHCSGANLVADSVAIEVHKRLIAGGTGPPLVPDYAVLPVWQGGVGPVPEPAQRPERVRLRALDTTVCYEPRMTGAVVCAPLVPGANLRAQDGIDKAESCRARLNPKYAPPCAADVEGFMARHGAAGLAGLRTAVQRALHSFNNDGLSIHDFIASQPACKRQAHLNALIDFPTLESVVADPTQYEVNGFLKVEGMPISKTQRFIYPRKPSVALWTGYLVWRVEKALYAAGPDDGSGPGPSGYDALGMVKGKAVKTRSAELAGWMAGYDYVWENDYSSFDMSLPEPLLAWVYRVFWAEFYPDDVTRKHFAELRSGIVRMDTERWKIVGGRRSGDAHTSLENGIVNFLVTHCALHRVYGERDDWPAMFASLRLAVEGDDGVVGMQGMRPGDAAALQAAVACLGMDAKAIIRPPAGSLFCGRWMVLWETLEADGLPSDRGFTVPDTFRMLKKMHVNFNTKLPKCTTHLQPSGASIGLAKDRFWAKFGGTRRRTAYMTVLEEERVGHVCSTCVARVLACIIVHAAKMQSLLEDNGHDPIVGAIARSWRRAYMGAGNAGEDTVRLKESAERYDEASDRWWKVQTEMAAGTDQRVLLGPGAIGAMWHTLEENTGYTRDAWESWVAQVEAWLEGGGRGPPPYLEEPDHRECVGVAELLWFTDSTYGDCLTTVAGCVRELMPIE